MVPVDCISRGSCTKICVFGVQFGEWKELELGIVGERVKVSWRRSKRRCLVLKLRLSA